VHLVGPHLLHLLFLDVVKIVSVEDDFLYFFLRQETWEKVIASERIGQINSTLIVCGVSFCIGRHLFLQHQEVHDLVKHCKRGRALRNSLNAGFLKHIGRLLSVHFEWLDALSEHINLLKDAFQIGLKWGLQNF